MATVGNSSTQEKIFEVAVRLFSNLGVPRVSMRDLAGEVGISAAAIYNHYPSKDSILDAMYSYYSEQQARYRPKLETLLAQCETTPVDDLLAQFDFHFDPEIAETMDRIVVVASTEARFDQRSAAFIEKNLLTLPELITIPVLKRLIELGRIEPVNLTGIDTLLSNYVYAAAVRNHSPYPVKFDEWENGFATLCSLIKPIDAPNQ